MTIEAPPLYRYAVRYRRDVESNRTYRVTVTAPDADHARAYAALADPLYLVSVESPRRVAEVIECCRFCGRSEPIAEGLYAGVTFEDGIALVCDVCRERGEE